MNVRISINPDIYNGRPIITGTRITVHTVLGFLGAGESIQSVLEEYPSLSLADIHACFAYGARVLNQPFVLEPVA